MWDSECGRKLKLFLKFRQGKIRLFSEAVSFLHEGGKNKGNAKVKKPK